MTRAWPQYTVLALLLIAAGVFEGAMLTDIVKTFLHPENIPSIPFSVKSATRTIGSAGPLQGDQILAIDGQPFTRGNQLTDAVSRAHPGDKLHLVLSAPSGEAMERDVVVGSQSLENWRSFYGLAVTLTVYAFIPLLCLFLGFGVALIRPRDRNAWLLLIMLIGFSDFLSTSDWQRSLPDYQFFWHTLCNLIWAPGMLLFSIYFPTRLPLDRRMAWLKYLVIVPALAGEAYISGATLIWKSDIAAALLLRPYLVQINVFRLLAATVTVSAFFAILGTKSGTESLPDDRRRLRILVAGTSVSLTPLFLIVLFGIVSDRDTFSAVPWPVEVVALCMMGLFPLTVAYVIVVERAMGLSFVVRQSVKYGFARGGFWVLRTFFIGLAVYVLSNHVGQQLRPFLVSASVIGLLVARRKNTEKASAWLDRKFFREAYDAETVLSDLALEVGRYVEIDPLLETVARRISTTMHVPDIVILVRDGGVYKTRYSTRGGQPLELAAQSRLLSTSGEQDRPLEVYLDNPQPWVRSLDADELQALTFMRSELLLALRGRGNEEGQIIGVMSLGGKQSELPYTKTDLRLLQTIAVQMGMALQNSRLAVSLASETAHREVMNREVEIAREVQERLFPQGVPAIDGLDCAGYCRPARGVGGDYYDFIDLPHGRLGIAIGDVSGKGIAAALLMASLQASLRGQAMAGVHDLAELMRNVNKLVYGASQSNRYATFFYAELDPATRELAFVNAGHNAPVILRQNGQVDRLEASGPVVGLLPGADYSMERCHLLPGDIFVGYTDGISEAMNEREEEWEEDRFIAAAQSCADCGAKEMIERIVLSADQFTGSAAQYDDMTLLIMKVRA